MSLKDHTTALAAVIGALRASPKYQHVCDDVLARVALTELTKFPRPADAIKEAKNTLHQIGAAYLIDRPNYAAWLRDIEHGWSADATTAGKATHTERILAHHASTRERLPILSTFYPVIFEAIRDLAGPNGRRSQVESLLDVACGLNPLCRPWMPISSECDYVGLDVFEDMIAFINAVYATWRVRGCARACDCSRPTEGAAGPHFMRHYDVAFLFKCLPVMDMVERGSARRLLDAIRATYLVVSYPIASLGGHARNMAATYEAQFNDLIADRGWIVRKLTFSTELVFVVRCATI